MKQTIKIKPHHFIDIITSLADVPILLSPHPYGHAVHSISECILKNRAVILEFELGADDICQPCKHNNKDICDDIIDTSFRPQAPASKREWNLIIEQRWCQRLKIKPGDKMPVIEFCNLLKENCDTLNEIYPENPVDRTLVREKNLKKGLEKYLQNAVEYMSQGIY